MAGGAVSGLAVLALILGWVLVGSGRTAGCDHCDLQELCRFAAHAGAGGANRGPQACERARGTGGAD